MPVICPATSERNFTPTSTALLSGSAAVPGVVVLLQMEQGQVAAAAGAAAANPFDRRLARSASSNPIRTPGRTGRRADRRRGVRRTTVTTATPRARCPSPEPGAGVADEGM